MRQITIKALGRSPSKELEDAPVMVTKNGKPFRVILPVGTDADGTPLIKGTDPDPEKPKASTPKKRKGTDRPAGKQQKPAKGTDALKAEPIKGTDPEKAIPDPQEKRPAVQPRSELRKQFQRDNPRDWCPGCQNFNKDCTCP